MFSLRYRRVQKRKEKKREEEGNCNTNESTTKDMIVISMYKERKRNDKTEDTRSKSRPFMQVVLVVCTIGATRCCSPMLIGLELQCSLVPCHSEE